ncbi:MAG: hypothetical protein J0665_04855 [Deltaproteobacteria bacterium]|nr:hypothetical protein [Deltaproteobacteria bacterium]
MDSTTESRPEVGVSKRGRGGRRHPLNLKATVNAFLGMSYAHFPLILPGVHRTVAPLIMFRLKRRGFSNCRVEVSGSGLVVYADR